MNQLVLYIAVQRIAYAYSTVSTRMPSGSVVPFVLVPYKLWQILFADAYYFRHRLASRGGIVMLGISVCVCVCVYAEPQLHTALVSAAKVMRCIQ